MARLVESDMLGFRLHGGIAVDDIASIAGDAKPIDSTASRLFKVGRTKSKIKRLSCN